MPNVIANWSKETHESILISLLCMAENQVNVLNWMPLLLEKIEQPDILLSQLFEMVLNRKNDDANYLNLLTSITEKALKKGEWFELLVMTLTMHQVMNC